MFKGCPITFEASQAKAVEYLNCEKKTARLLAGVWSKANWNYDALLSVWESLHTLARLVRARIAGTYSAPVGPILAALAALIYFVEPFDLIPDGVPVFGLLDDVAVITLVVRSNLKEISKFRNWECS